MLPPTRDQELAINHEGGNLLILACAGSGKTETLARRIARMISGGTDRGSIVAFTFTEHAATELKQRIRAKLEEALPHEPALGDMYVGTIHSFCLRILRESQPKYRQYEVMDDARQAALIATNFVRFEDSGSGIGLDRLRVRTKSKTYAETLRTFVNTLNIIYQQKLDVNKVADSVLADSVQTYEKISAGYPNYFFDFNRIVDELISYLEKNSKVLMDLRSKLSHVFVDEYQDVDDRQEELIWLLTNGGRDLKVTVVGDDDQALYGFRGASVRNILNFESKYPNTTRITLSENFRSTHAIVSIADEAIKEIEGKRIEKEPVARRISEDGSRIEHLADKGDIQLYTCETEEEEALWVVKRIKALRGVAYKQKNGILRGLDYGDMAILLRSVRSTGSVFAETLRKHNIPVVISGTAGLFNNDEIRLIQASFSLLSRSEFALPDESGRIELLATIDTREFVRNTIKTLRDTGRLGAYAHHTRYLSWIDKIRADLDQRSLKKEDRGRKGARIYPQAIYQEMLTELGANVDEWPPDMMFNFGAFSELLSQFEAVHQWITPARLKNLTLFLSNWAAKNVDEGGLSELSSLNSVKVMTVHAAKGLEWPVVFLPQVSSRIFPSSMRTRGPDSFLPDGAFDKNVYIGGNDGERRLWYVALTRCEKFLNISSVDRKGKKPTDYFNKIKHDCVRRNGDDPTNREHIEPQPPIGSELLPTTYSDLSAFWRCEYEYGLRSLMDFSPGVGEQFGYGQQIHNILAVIHQRAIEGDKVTGDEVDQLVDQQFHLRYTRGDPFEAMKFAAKRALKNYVNKYGEEVLKARAFEKPFEFVDQGSGAMISGVVDLLEAGKESLPPSKREIVGLIDFKAKKIKSDEEYEQLEQSVSEQLQLYALGVKYALSKEPGSAAAHIISHSPLPESVIEKGKSERIPVDISDEAQRAALNRVAGTVSMIREKISNQKFERTGVKSGKCKHCDYRVFCKGYQEYLVENKNKAIISTPVEDAESEVDELMEDIYAGQKSE